MQSINMLQANTQLSRLVEAIEQGAVREIVIARNGRPVVRLVPIEPPSPQQRIGIAKGALAVPDDIDTQNDEVARSFLGQDAAP